MGKNRKRKRPNQAQPPQLLPKNKDRHKSRKSNDNEEEEGEESNASSSTNEEHHISDEDLFITIATLQKISTVSSRQEQEQQQQQQQQQSRPMLTDKRFKQLRQALHPFVLQQLQSYQHGTDYRIKVTQYLAIQQWSDALASLQGCLDFGQIPKQGTIQRWVRDCDSCTIETCKLQLLNAILTLASPSTTIATAVNRTTTHESDSRNAHTTASVTADNDTDQQNGNRHDPRLAILLIQQQKQQNDHEGGPLSVGTETGLSTATMIATATAPDVAANAKENAGLEMMPDWSIGRLMTNRRNENETENSHENDDRHAPTNWDQLPTIHLNARILYHEAAAERTPPNHYDLLLHTAEPGAIQWSESPPTVVKHRVPFLGHMTTNAGTQGPGVDAFLLENVLTVDECQQLRAAATQLGWRPDHPIALEKPTGIDSCEWLVDASIINVISTRVRPYLPHVCDTTSSNATHTSASLRNDDGTTIHYHSINPRWRFFRYGQGCVYRPHIDGSWPASRINPHTGKYECYSQGDDDNDGERGSSSPWTTTIKSYHTFLIYLNDNFEGGQTRFYVPTTTTTTSHHTGTTNLFAAHGVTPKCGSVLVFSQGNVASLLHEGAAVTHGQKFVVRTDVLYQTTKAKPNTTKLPHGTTTQKRRR